MNPVLIGADCLVALREMEPNSIDAVVTDPPYHLTSIVKRFGGAGAAPALSNGPTGVYARSSAGFMGKQWDGGDIAFRPETWAEVLRVMKPGAHLVAFGAPKNYHRLACAIEDAGFELRDSLMWIFGSGFPKSLDVSKAIDKAAGAEREVVGYSQGRSAPIHGGGQSVGALDAITAPATDAARQWQGWGTALKPAYEPIVLARKPLGAKTVAENVLKYGTGAINVDGARIKTAEALGRLNHTTSKFIDSANGSREAHARSVLVDNSTGKGRFPANLIHDGSQEVLDLFAAFGEKKSAGAYRNPGRTGVKMGNLFHMEKERRNSHAGETGTAARFFYTAKASKADRAGSKHPTVKPISLMQYLVRLITPPGGTVLDPFAGSGTTGEAARREGFASILIEREEEYQADIRRRFGLELAAAE